MRSVLPVCVCLVFLQVAARGQEATLPKSGIQDEAPPRRLIPDDVLPMPPAKTGPVLPPNLPSIPQLDEAFAKNPLTTAAEEYRRRIEWRKLRNAVVNDPDLKAALKVAENARTDLEKRKMLRAYYELYFGKMAALAATPEMKTYVDTRKKEQLSSLTQPHVRPEPSAAPSPTPTPVVAPPPEPLLPDAESSASPTP